MGLLDKNEEGDGIIWYEWEWLLDKNDEGDGIIIRVKNDYMIRVMGLLDKKEGDEGDGIIR